MSKFASKRARIACGISTMALVAAAALWTPAMAQTLSTLQGRVEGAAPGTVVTAVDENTGQRSTGTVDANGTYTIVGLRPSRYHVEVAGQPAQEVVIPVGQTVSADFVRTAAVSTGDEIVVTGHRAQTEVRSAVITTNVTTAQIENLPQNDRNFLNFAALAPGVTVTPTSGARQFSAGAVSSSQTNVFIDGLSLKNPVNHGGVVGQNFSRGNPFPQLAIQEFAVNTQNFKAQYEQAGSAIITAVTKTGGEKFHGDVFGQWQPKAFIGRPYFDRPGNANNQNGDIPKPDYNRWQYGADFGGPIIKNLLHFYVAFEATDQTLPSTNVNLNGGGTDQVPADIASSLNGNYGQNFKQKLYFGKLTLFATAEDTVNASAFLRRESNLSDFGGNAAPEHGRTLLSDVDTYQLEWNHRHEGFLNELVLAYNTASNGTPRVTDGPEIVLERQARDNGVLLFDENGVPVVSRGNEDAFLGANSFVQDDHQKIFTVQDYVTYSTGHHVIKGGVKLNFTKLERTEDANSNGSYFFLDRSYTGFDSSIPALAQVTTIPVRPASAKDTQIGVFIQDDWSPDIHWTVNAGIRWDYETNAKNEDFVTPADTAAALRAYQPWQAAGINPEDYISNGHNRHPYTKAFQPRLGVSYDVNGDRDLVFFGGLGRYYDRPLFIESGIEQIKNLYQSAPLVHFCNGAGGAYGSVLTACSLHANDPSYLPYSPGLKDPDALRNLVVSTGLKGDVWLLNNDTKLPYSDEFDIGVRKRFGDIRASLTFSHIRSRNLFMFVRGNRLPSGQYTDYPTTRIDGVTITPDTWIDDIVPVEGQLPGHSGKLNIGSNGGKARYDAIYLQLEKPFNADSKWGFTSTLTISRARTNIGQDLGSDEAFNSGVIDAYGWNYVPGSEKFRFVGSGIVRGPWDTTLSGTVTLASGPSFGEVIFGLPNTPPTACCYGNFAGVHFPKTFFGYKNLDLRIAKNVHTPWGHDVMVDFQAFNVFDWVNRNYSAWDSGSRNYDAATQTITQPRFQENGTVGNARSFQVGVKYSF